MVEYIRLHEDIVCCCEVDNRVDVSNDSFTDFTRRVRIRLLNLQL